MVVSMSHLVLPWLNAHLCVVWRWWRGWGRSSSCSVPACSRIPRSGAAAPQCRPPSAGSAPSAAVCLETGWRCPRGPDSVRKTARVQCDKMSQQRVKWSVMCSLQIQHERLWSPTRQDRLSVYTPVLFTAKTATFSSFYLVSCCVVKFPAERYRLWLFTSVKWTSCVAVRLKPCWLLSCCSRLCVSR